jgi:hypothetical protein
MTALFYFLLSLSWGSSVFFPGRNRELIDDYKVSENGVVQVGVGTSVSIFNKDEIPNAPYVKTSYAVKHPNKESSLQIWVDRKSKFVAKIVEARNFETTMANYDSNAHLIDIAYCNRQTKDCLVLDQVICEKFLKATGKDNWFDFAQELKNCSEVSHNLNLAVRKNSEELLGRMKVLFQTRVIDEQTSNYGDRDPNIPFARQRNTYKPSFLVEWAINQSNGNSNQYKFTFNIANYQVEDQLAKGCYQIQKSNDFGVTGPRPATIRIETSTGTR